MVKKTCRQYSETFRLEVLRDYYYNGQSLRATAAKWGLSRASTLQGWIQRCPIGSECLSLPHDFINRLQMASQGKSKEQLLEEEISRLHKALELEKLRSQAFKKLIEIAEKEEGISILKKDGAKQ